MGISKSGKLAEDRLRELTDYCEPKVEVRACRGV